MLLLLLLLLLLLMLMLLLLSQLLLQHRLLRLKAACNGSPASPGRADPTAV